MYIQTQVLYYNFVGDRKSCVVSVGFQLVPLKFHSGVTASTIYMRITLFYTRVTSLYQTQVWLTRLTFVQRGVENSTRAGLRSEMGHTDFFVHRIRAPPRG